MVGTHPTCAGEPRSAYTPKSDAFRRAGGGVCVRPMRVPSVGNPNSGPTVYPGRRPLLIRSGGAQPQSRVKPREFPYHHVRPAYGEIPPHLTSGRQHGGPQGRSEPVRVKPQRADQAEQQSCHGRGVRIAKGGRRRGSPFGYKTLYVCQTSVGKPMVEAMEGNGKPEHVA